MKNKLLFVFLILIGTLMGCVSKEKTLQVTDAWVRPGLAGGNSAIYFVITNNTPNPAVLNGAESDSAETVEVHMSKMDDSGKMTMMHQETVEIPAEISVDFKPGGYHVMLINLKNDLNVDDTVEFSLLFENNDPITLQAKVKQP